MLSAIGMCVESEGEVRENATDQAQDKIKQKSDFAKKYFSLPWIFSYELSVNRNIICFKNSYKPYF